MNFLPDKQKQRGDRAIVVEFMILSAVKHFRLIKSINYEQIISLLMAKIVKNEMDSDCLYRTNARTTNKEGPAGSLRVFIEQKINNESNKYLLLFI